MRLLDTFPNILRGLEILRKISFDTAGTTKDYSNIPGRSKYFHGKISDVLNNKIEISFDKKELFSYFFRQILTNLSGQVGAKPYFA